jgi:hypothetical protein
MLATMRHEYATGIQPGILTEQLDLKIMTHQRPAELDQMQVRLRARLQPQAAAANHA